MDSDSEEQPRYLFRIYNIPHDEQKLVTLLDNLTIKYKNIWMAKPGDETFTLTWAWLEFHTRDDLEIAKSYLHGMKWHSHTLMIN
jgi:hypothetical protein